MLTEGFNPYDELQDLKRFAQHADTHLHNLLRMKNNLLLQLIQSLIDLKN